MAFSPRRHFAFLLQTLSTANEIPSLTLEEKERVVKLCGERYDDLSDHRLNNNSRENISMKDILKDVLQARTTDLPRRDT